MAFNRLNDEVDLFTYLKKIKFYLLFILNRILLKVIIIYFKK